MPAALTGCPSLSGDQTRAVIAQEEPLVTLRGDRSVLVLPASLSDLLRTDALLKKYDSPAHFLSGKWARFAQSPQLPYAAWGDVTGDGRADVCLFLSESAAPHRAYRWYVYLFKQNAQGRFDEKGTFRLDVFEFTEDVGRPIQEYRVKWLESTDAVTASATGSVGSSPAGAFALTALNANEDVTRVYRWDHAHHAVRRTILDKSSCPSGVCEPGGQILFDGVGLGRTLQLPTCLERVLQDEQPDLRLPESRDSRRGGWSEFNAVGRLPWATTGDYNGDGLTDVALILLDGKTGGQRQWRTMAFLQTDNGCYESFVLKTFRESIAGPRHRLAGQTIPAPPASSYVLLTAPAGSKEIGSWNDDRYRHDAIVLTTFPERPLDSIEGALIAKWSPRTNSFTGSSFGTMND
jgi:hypothetical protein